MRGPVISGSLWALLAWLLAQPPQSPKPAPAQAPPATVESLQRTVEELSAKVEKQGAELEAEKLMRETAAATPTGEVPEERPAIRLYGFMDAGIQRMMPKSTSALALTFPTKKATFVLGNINLYIDAQPSDSWSALVETRLTNAPDGLSYLCSQVGPCLPTSTAGYDNTSAAGWTPIRWGSIVLERAYIQWRYSDKLQVRIGTFLTPFGIWNIDHGTPTVISLLVPNFESNELIPIRQTGLELLGTAQKGDWEGGYFAYASNGRTPGQVDFTDDKMLGGRLFLRRTFPLRFGFGLSALMNRYSDTRRIVTSLTPYRVTHSEQVAYHEKVAGADLWMDAGPLRLRSEFALRRIDYVPGKRELEYGVPGVFAPDRTEWNYYLLAAYQLPWLGLEPFVYAELYRIPTFISQGAILPSIGFNIHLTPYAQIKAQYLFVHFSEVPGFFSGRYKDQDAHVLATRLVLVF
jgi:hypothetical protein